MILKYWLLHPRFLANFFSEVILPCYFFLLSQSPDVGSQDGNEVASLPSPLFSPIFPTVQHASATVKHSSLSGIRQVRRGRNFCHKEGQGFTAWAAQLPIIIIIK